MTQLHVALIVQIFCCINLHHDPFQNISIHNIFLNEKKQNPKK